MILPPQAAAVLLPLAPAFTAPTFDRFVLLLLSAILTTGRRTVANLLRTLGGLAPGHRTSYQRVLSGARWPGLKAAWRRAWRWCGQRPGVVNLLAGVVNPSPAGVHHL